MFKDKIASSLTKAVGQKKVFLEFPEAMEHGDYATNICLINAKKQAKKPIEYAKQIKALLEKDKDLLKIVSKIEVAGPGFINFTLSLDSLMSNLKSVNKSGDSFGKSSLNSGKKILLEHTSPNTIKTLHIGHVRNNALGMAVHNILEFTGFDVKLDAINNDRGIHVMKALWAYLKEGGDKTPKDIKPDHFVDSYYAKGVKDAEDENNLKEMRDLLKKWEDKDSEVRSQWKKMRDWTLEGFRQTYKRLASHHDHQWFESDFFEEGKGIVERGLKSKVFKRLEDGAVLSNLEKYGLPDTIVLRADGTSMYHTQDLRLTELKKEKYPSDLYIWDIGPEQSLYLKQLFAMCEQLGIGKTENYLHLSYGFVFLKGGGKMSSRKGNVISADWLIDEMVRKAEKIIQQSDTSRGLGKSEIKSVSEAVGIGAIKYSLLKTSRDTDIYFGLDESLALEGNSGPYLQYTYARIQSVLKKLRNPKEENARGLNEEETLLLRLLVRFPEVLVESANNFAPNLVVNYIYELAQKYNNFYSKHKIIGSSNEAFRLNLSSACGTVLKNGLKLLGIDTPERM